jgi:hypothetical protein
MEEGSVYMALCGAIRKAVPPSREVYFSLEHLRGRKPRVTVVFASIVDTHLALVDEQAMLASMKGVLLMASSTQAVIAGALNGERYEIHLKCEPPEDYAGANSLASSVNRLPTAGTRSRIRPMNHSQLERPTKR